MTEHITGTGSYRLISGMMAILGLRRAPRSLRELAQHALHQRVMVERCRHCGFEDECRSFQNRHSSAQRPPDFCANRYDLRKPN